MDKIYAIGDIHGCLQKLQELMAQIHPDAVKDTLIFMGDYIDRGPDSRGVVEHILNLEGTFQRLVCLMGNHEQMFLDYLNHQQNRDLYFQNGGQMTLRSYGLSLDEPVGTSDVPQDHLRFFNTLLPYYETEDYLFVHAGLRPGVPMKKQRLHDLLWIRGEFIFGPCTIGKTVIFGHSPFRRPYANTCKIGIDTGAVFGGALTCLILPDRTFVRV